MGRGGEAFSLFKFRACLNSLARKSGLLEACLFLPATLLLSQPQGLLCSHCCLHPTPQPKNKDKHPLPSPPALPARVTQAGGPVAAALLSCLHLLLICAPDQ